MPGGYVMVVPPANMLARVLAIPAAAKFALHLGHGLPIALVFEGLAGGLGRAGPSG